MLRSLLENPTIWISCLLETTLMLGVLRPVDAFVHREIAVSLLYSGFAVTSFQYGYGIVHLRLIYTLNDFLSRLCGVSVKVWQRLGFLTLLPWMLKALADIKEHSLRLREYRVEDEESFLLLCCELLLLTAQLIYFNISLLFAINYRHKMQNNLRITRNMEGHEMLAYVQAVNQSFGFEMIQIPQQETFGE